MEAEIWNRICHCSQFGPTKFPSVHLHQHQFVFQQRQAYNNHTHPLDIKNSLPYFFQWYQNLCIINDEAGMGVFRWSQSTMMAKPILYNHLLLQQGPRFKGVAWSSGEVQGSIMAEFPRHGESEGTFWTTPSTGRQQGSFHGHHVKAGIGLIVDRI